MFDSNTSIITLYHDCPIYFSCDIYWAVSSVLYTTVFYPSVSYFSSSFSPFLFSRSSSLSPSLFQYFPFPSPYSALSTLSLHLQVGYRIMDVQADSPASRGKLEPLIDLVVSASGKPLRTLDSTFIDLIKVRYRLQRAYGLGLGLG